MRHARFFAALFAFAVLAGFGATVAWAAPYLTLDNFSGTAVSGFAVSGGGFSGNESIFIYGGPVSTTPLAAASTTFHGFYGPINVTLSSTTPAGPLAITGVGQTSGATASNTFWVQPRAANVTATSTGNLPGAMVLISGAGFASAENVIMTLASSTVSAVSDSAGHVAANITVPNSQAGTYIIRAAGQTSGAEAIYYFYISGFYPSATPSAYYVLPGNSMTFTGSGFMPSEVVSISADFSPAILATAAADSAGSFSDAGSISIPYVTAGVHTINLTGRMSGATASIMVTIGQLFGFVFPSSYYVQPGQTLTFSGNSYGAAETVDVFSGTSTVLVASFVTDTSGSFSGAGGFVIPAALASSNTAFYLQGRTSSVRSSVTIAVASFYPNISPSSYFVVKGQNFSASGTGFAAGENVILDWGIASATVATDGNGDFQSGQIAMPFSAGSNLELAASGQTSRAQVSVSIAVGQLYPIATPSAWFVFPGSTITFSAAGFGPNETVEIKSGSSMTLAAADSAGGFSGAAVAAPWKPGSATFDFKGKTSGAAVSVTVAVGAFYPTLTSDSYWAQPGSTIILTAKNFAPNESVNFTGAAATDTAVADSSGAATGTLTLPFGSPNPLVITAFGATSQAAASTSISLAPFLQQITPSLWWVVPGAQLTFTGSGFVPRETVSFSLNSQFVTSTAADSSGGFSLIHTIPVSTGSSVAASFAGSLSQTTATVNIGVGSLNPGISLNTYWNVGGVPFSVSGYGFAAGETVDISFDSVVLGSLAADLSGNFTLATSVPFTASGNKIVMARGAASRGVAIANFTEPPFYISLQLSSYAPAAGSSVAATGGGFLPGEPIEVTSNMTSSTIATIQADGGGTINSAIPVPAVSPGLLTLTFRGLHSFTQQSVIIYVTP